MFTMPKKFNPLHVIRPNALMANNYDWLEDLTSQEEDMMLKALSICRISISIRVKRPLCTILYKIYSCLSTSSFKCSHETLQFGSKAMAHMSLLCPCNVVD
jgi:hypothetical protein